MDNIRKAEVWHPDLVSDTGDCGWWEVIPFANLKKGDRFRLVEPNGVLADDSEEAVAESDPYLQNAYTRKYADFVDVDDESPARQVLTIECTVVE